MKKIMIIEDDKVICNELFDLLSNADYLPIVIVNFRNIKSEILSAKPDLILLDINLPYLNGELFLKELRKESDIPVIMLTSRLSECDEVLSMSYGADDYITKPYNPTILLLRISAILKRTNKTNNNLIYRNLKIIPQKGIITNGSEELLLTKNEMIIFLMLLNNKGKIVSRDELMTDLWDNDEYINDNALTVNISRLRQKLSNFGYSDVIETRKKLGYILL